MVTMVGKQSLINSVTSVAETFGKVMLCTECVSTLLRNDSANGNVAMEWPSNHEKITRH